MTESQLMVQRLVSAFTVLEPVRQEHLDDMDGELLPYLLMADVARWAQAEVGRRPDTVDAILAWLDGEFTKAADPEKDLIALGFVEVIEYTPVGDPLLQRLGPELRAVAAQLGLLTQPAPLPTEE